MIVMYVNRLFSIVMMYNILLMVIVDYEMYFGIFFLWYFFENGIFVENCC